MAVLLQLNGDLPEWFPSHDRRLYIFTCKSKACRRKEGSIRAIRAVRLPKAVSKEARGTHEKTVSQEDRSEKKQPQNLGNMLFNSSSQPQTSGNANPFSMSASPASSPFSASTQTGPFNSHGPPPKPPSSAPNPPLAPPTLSETFAQKVRLSSPAPAPTSHEPWPPLSDIPSPYPSYHLDADFETLDAPHLPSSSSARPMDIDDPPSTTSKDEDADTFESPSLDKTFRRFADRLAQNPLQVLRYEFAGSPLLYSKFDAVGKLLAPHQSPQPNITANMKITTSTSSQSKIPPCQNCNAARVFELQLTPQAIAELEADEVGLEGMEWGNVLLGVCSADCVPRDVEAGKVGYAEEWVGVQWEERR